MQLCQAGQRCRAFVEQSAGDVCLSLCSDNFQGWFPFNVGASIIKGSPSPLKQISRFNEKPQTLFGDQMGLS